MSDPCAAGPASRLGPRLAFGPTVVAVRGRVRPSLRGTAPVWVLYTLLLLVCAGFFAAAGHQREARVVALMAPSGVFLMALALRGGNRRV